MLGGNLPMLQVYYHPLLTVGVITSMLAILAGYTKPSGRLIAVLPAVQT